LISKFEVDEFATDQEIGVIPTASISDSVGIPKSVLI
jgi:hypothetical protein